MALQIHLLDGIASSLSAPRGRLMFQGGTSISTVHGSPRWSEDIDFVVSPDMSLEIDSIRSRVEAIAANRIARATPGASFHLVDKGKAKGRVREADPGTVLRWIGRWEHPNRIGVVRVKAEFYIAEACSTARYRTVLATPEAAGVKAGTSIPTATLDTLWADKIMAMSARPAMKWRDVYDLGFVMDRIGEVDDNHLYERLGVSCRSYRGTMGDIHAGLCRDYITKIPNCLEDFLEDMRVWLPEEEFRASTSDGTLKRYHATCAAQIDRARGMIAGREPLVDRPTGREDCECGL